MQTSTTQSSPLQASSPASVASHPWLMLISRSVLFILIQGLLALILMATGTRSALDESARWWMLIVSLANIISIYFLVRLFSLEGKRYFDVIHFSRETWKTDLFWFVVASMVGIPIATVVKDPLAVAIFGDAMIPTTMMFRELPTWAFILSFLFPITIAFVELPTYFVYVMPRNSKHN